MTSFTDTPLLDNTRACVYISCIMHFSHAHRRDQNSLLLKSGQPPVRNIIYLFVCVCLSYSAIWNERVQEVFIWNVYAAVCLVGLFGPWNYRTRSPFTVVEAFCSCTGNEWYILANTAVLCSYHACVLHFCWFLWDAHVISHCINWLKHNPIEKKFSLCLTDGKLPLVFSIQSGNPTRSGSI